METFPSRPRCCVWTLIKKGYLPSGAILYLHDELDNKLGYRARADIKYGDKIGWLYPGQYDRIIHPTYLACDCFRMAKCMPAAQIVGANYWHYHYNNTSISLADLWTKYLNRYEGCPQ